MNGLTSEPVVGQAFGLLEVREHREELPSWKKRSLATFMLVNLIKNKQI